MSAAEVEPPHGCDAPTSVDPVVEQLDAMMVQLGGLVGDCSPVPEAVRIDRITLLERLRAVVAAAQAAETVRFAKSHTATQMAAGVHPRRIGKGIADQIGLACRISPSHGGRRLACARAWWFDLPHTYAALTAGQLSERVAEYIVEQTRHLDHDLRGQVDAQVVAAGITGMGVGAAEHCARKYAYEADRQAYIERGTGERKQRRVTLRAAPDTMTYLTGYLPLEQGVACWAALKAAADTGKATGDERSRGQILADTLVERLTGQAHAEDVEVEVQILIPEEVLTDPDSSRTATVNGHGPLPGQFAKDLIDRSNGRKRWRNVWSRAETTSPFERQARDVVVDLDQRRRFFTGTLADLLRLRDQHCRMPYCDAPIRHLDHITPYRKGGTTTLSNGQGLCERHNQLREQPGWHTTVIDDGLHSHPHRTIITTPTGHRYPSRAPDPP